jgi:alcohol dehydrogenase
MGEPDDGSKDGSRAVRAMRRVLADLNFPVLSSLGITEADIDHLADLAMADFFITQAPVPWTKQEVVDAFMAALSLTSR